MAGVDAKDGEIAIQGWQETAGDYIRWAETFELLGAGCLLYTNVDVEGLQQGVAIGPVRILFPESTYRLSLPVAYPDVRILLHSGRPGRMAQCSARRCTAERLTFQRH